MNWGNRLLVAFLIFGTGMIYLVFQSMRVQTDLVETDYYQKELNYQSELDASTRGVKIGGVQVNQTSDTIQLTWPLTQKNKKLTGEAWFYCAYNKKQDRRIPIQTMDGNMQIEKKKLNAGRYTIKLNWSDGTETFYQENTIDLAE